jgi:hypothetical protein
MTDSKVQPTATWLDDYRIERKTRHRAVNRGFTIVRMRGLEATRRQTLGVGLNMLIDHERVHLFAATLEQIDAYIGAFPKRPSLLLQRAEGRA